MTHVMRGLQLLLAVALGAGAAYALLRAPSRALPEAPALLQQVREVTRLETLDVSLYKKVDFTPHPEATDALWKDVLNWARYSLRTPRGRAIVFADVHLGYDFQRLDASALRVAGTAVEVALPPLDIRVELRPGETEVIDSNLDSQETARLLELARGAFEHEVRADENLRQRARRSAEQSLRALFLSLGFREVRFVDALPPGTAG
ncbi:DUF4230 domain-containing protein [Myxococcaceae bacterium GXIMD 01537]